jgi:hypothetical protein
MSADRSQPVYAKYIEHVPPDGTAGIFWLKNRDQRADVMDLEPENDNLTVDREALDGSSPALPQISTRIAK